METGTLYGVGVGPGDPELLTLKAVRVVRESPVIAVPQAKADGNSYALDVVTGLLRPEQRIVRLVFPMVRDASEREKHRAAAAETLRRELRTGADVAFLTEGDPLLHSTFIHVLDELPADVPVEIVPGVSSISAAAAQARLPLVSADQRLAVVPAVFEDEAELRRTLRDFDTVVFLKFRGALDRLLDLLDEMGLVGRAVAVERASHASGRVVRDVRSLRGGDVHYLSLLIVRTDRTARS